MSLKVNNDISGKRFGKLVAIRHVPDNSGQSRYMFRCDCGNEIIRPAYYVISGDTSSCGCLNRALISERSTKHGHARRGQHSNAYVSWVEIFRRCEDQKNHAYKRYGGRGITVCERWRDFNNFYSDMGERPNGTSIDRIDNSKGYSPENCRWASPKEQARNSRSTIRVIYDGRNITALELCEELGISISKLRKRVLRMGNDYTVAFGSFGIAARQVIAA